MPQIVVGHFSPTPWQQLAMKKYESTFTTARYFRSFSSHVFEEEKLATASVIAPISRSCVQNETR